MPLYEYECDACLKRFERIQKFSDPLIEVCPSCGGTVRKLLSSPAIQFKGSGWYVNDYAKKSSGKADEKPAKEATSSDSSSTKASTDTSSASTTTPSSTSSTTSGSGSSGSSQSS